MGCGFESRRRQRLRSSRAEQFRHRLFPGLNLRRVRIESNVMSNLQVINGTPAGNAHLCRKCSHGQFTRGYRESDVLVICTNVAPNRKVPFVVYECSELWDRNRPSFGEMTKLALDFSDGRRKRTPGFRTAGFATVRVGDDDDDDDEDDIEDESALD